MGWLLVLAGRARADEPTTTNWFDLDPAALAQRYPIATDTSIARPVPAEPPREVMPSSMPLIQQAAVDARPRMDLFWDNGAVMESADKAFRLHVGGRFDFDSTVYHESNGLPFDLQDGSDMRRARFRADGSIGEYIDFVTEVNFANIQDVTNQDTTTLVGSVGLTDFYATFKQVPFFHNVRIGHFKEPIGLEHLTSSNDWYYMERSSGHDAFLQPFNFVNGIESFNTWCDDSVTAAIALTRVGKQTVTPFAFGAGDGEIAVTGRVTCLPIYEDDGRRLLHFGVGYSYGGTDNNNFSTANRPLVRAGAGSMEVPNIIATGSFFTNDPVQFLDFEFAAVHGRYALSAEYQAAYGHNVFGQLNNGVFSDPRGDVTYQSFYVEGGFFLNADDYRRFDKQSAVWGRQYAATCESGGSQSPWLFDHTPVQLICRYTYLDLASGNPVLTPSSGALAGWENDITAGVDWYINPEVHFIVNYVYTHLTYVNGTGGDINGLGCRLHLDF
jgi:phosphate-selective porin OprO/OprP